MRDNLVDNSISNISQQSISQIKQAHSLHKKAVLNWLNKITIGRLTLIDGEESFSFGKQDAQESLVAHIHIHNNAAYGQMLTSGTLGAAESFMLGQWSSPDLVKVIRVMAANIEQAKQLDQNKNLLKKGFSYLYDKLTQNNLIGSRKNIAAHYDLGNDFFSLFLDPTMMYSSAIFAHENASLEDASINKLRNICDKLRLDESDHLIEIGTGWGGLACYAAKNYGCKVTTTTISQEQFDYACAKVKRLKLEDKVTVIFKDYRELEGSYDKLVSIEMIEAVGHQYFSTFFQKCNELVKDDGLMLIQAITISDQRFHEAKNRIDFIKRYIFPGGCLPSNQIINQHISNDTNAQLVDIHDITLDYALTLKAWRDRFFEKIDDVKAQGYNDTFINMWNFYLCYCEGGFRERVIQTSQFVIAKPRAPYLSRHMGSV